MLTKKLATFITKTNFDSLPIEATEKAKSHILDCMGVMLAGSTQHVGKLITQFVKTMGGNPQSGVVAGGFKTSAPNAALANGTMGHALDFDDDSDTAISHPSVTVLPAILALGEDKASGKDVLTSYVIGEEVMARIASVPGLIPGHYEKGWHPTSTIGIIGAVTAGAKILDLDIEQIRTAFGIAASEASGLSSNFGTMVKPFHAGSAAAKSVAAALLAKAGFTANPNIFESPYGFLSLFGENEEFDVDKVTANLGRTFDIISPGINIKKYPCCYYTHSSMDALLYLLNEHNLSPKDIQHIRCGLSKIATQVLKHPYPANGMEAKFSLPYCLALILLNNEAKIEDFEDEKVCDTTINQYMKKIEPYVFPELNKEGKTLGAVIHIETTSGEKYDHQIEKPIGNGSSPLSWETLVSKFKYCSSLVLHSNDVEFLETSVKKLETIPKIKELVEVLSKEPKK